MKRTFYVKDIAVAILLVFGFLGVFYIFGKEVGTVSDKRKAEQSEEQIMSLPIQYKGRRDFHKVILEGHEYWYIENFKNNIGFCHSESCPCKTNKVEVVQ